MTIINNKGVYSTIFQQLTHMKVIIIVILIVIC